MKVRKTNMSYDFCVLMKNYKLMYDLSENLTPGSKFALLPGVGCVSLSLFQRY